jgi:hypothetical protein
MKIKYVRLFLVTLVASGHVVARDNVADDAGVSDQVIAVQNLALEENTRGQGFGPQSPRDVDAVEGTNPVVFSPAPASSSMNLCNIHFHAGAEHRGGEFTRYAGHGDGKGSGSGYQYSGKLTAAELIPASRDVCRGAHGGLKSGDTIEVHYVYSSARVTPGPTLGACLSDAIRNPQLRVEAQVYVLVNDRSAGDFTVLADHGIKGGLYQALNIPGHSGKPVVYAGSTTGPAYNEKGSPFQVTWSVRPKVVKVDIETVGKWCDDNVFNEDHAHGVRNLVVNPALLSEIKK